MGGRLMSSVPHTRQSKFTFHQIRQVGCNERSELHQTIRSPFGDGERISAAEISVE